MATAFRPNNKVWFRAIVKNQELTLPKRSVKVKDLVDEGDWVLVLDSDRHFLINLVSQEKRASQSPYSFERLAAEGQLMEF